MLKEITGLRLDGANFETPTDLQLFVDNNLRGCDTSRICLLYGKNGVGKTTISRSFKRITGDEVESIRLAMPIDENSTEVVLTDDERNHIYVFNEEFVEKQVRLQSEGLDTIVVLGAAINIEDQLKNATEQLADVKEKGTNQKELVTMLEDDTNSMSPAYCFTQVLNSLRGPGNWAERDMKLRAGARQATKVTAETPFKFLGRQPQKTRDELVVAFEEGLQQLQKARSGELKLMIKVPLHFRLQFDKESIAALLVKKIEEPVLSDREKFLLSLAKQDRHERLVEIRDFSLQSEAGFCPFCLQDVSKERKESLFSSIEKVLSTAVKEHKKSLEKHLQDSIELDLSPFLVLGEDAVQECNETLFAVNAAIEQINSAIKQKIANVYLPVLMPEVMLPEKFAAFMSSLNQLENKRLAYNKAITDVNPLSQKLSGINADIASYDIAEPFRRYEEQQKRLELESQKLIELRKEYSKTLETIRSLEAERRSITIAKDLINRWLSYIFYSDKRITVEAEGDRYYIKSAGQAVAPEKISTGERNTLALCYFFSTLIQEKENNKFYDDSCLLVIDDPVSSFDIENCVGVLSFLKWQLQSYLKGNKDTKVILMTHDLQTYFDLKKACDEIIAACNQMGAHNRIAYLALSQRKVEIFRFKRHAYASLMQDIYDFAVNGTEDKLSTIGNSMRRVVEAFSSFVYKTSIQDLSTTREILNQIDDVTIAPYFEHLLYRLVLHGGSHMEERVASLGSLDFDAYLSKETMQRTARDILCLLYCLNDLHVKKNLSEYQDAERTIMNWIADIKRMTS